MALESGQGHAPPSWLVSPGDQDIFAWVALGLLALAIYGIFFLYAKFDHWAEHRAKGTPLAKTIPTMLAVALLYEIFPLGHFNILLPIAAILIALMADWTHFRFGQTQDKDNDLGEDTGLGEPEEVETQTIEDIQTAEAEAEADAVIEVAEVVADKKPVTGEAQNV